MWLAPIREGDFLKEGIEKERGAKLEIMVLYEKLFLWNSGEEEGERVH